MKQERSIEKEPSYKLGQCIACMESVLDILNRPRYKGNDKQALQDFKEIKENVERTLKAVTR